MSTAPDWTVPGPESGPSDDVWQDPPKPEPLQAELPPVDPFSEDLLPDSFRALVADVADRMQVPIDFPATTLTLCLAGVVSRRATIQPKASDSSWIVVPNLWGGMIARPGKLKTPIVHASTAPLRQIESEWRGEHDENSERYKREKEKYELRHAAWKELYKAASKKPNSEPVPEWAEVEPEEPTPRRLTVNDATFEALHQIMSENPAGILVIRDEFTGWWNQLDRAGREGERPFCLEAWNGNSSFTVDRIGRGSIHVPHCCMSMLGGIQPGRLRSYLVDALADGPSDDGLIQRFQLLVWPDESPAWQYVDRPPHAEQRVESIFRELLKLDPENPLRFRFDPDAQELFVRWLTELEAKLRSTELHAALISHLSKYRSLLPSLALLFELADRYADGNSVNPSLSLTVSLEHTRQAAEWCDYLESHARRVYSCITTPQLHAAYELAKKIREKKVGANGFFLCREVYLKGWSSLDSPDAVKQAINVLVDSGWVREASPEPSPTGGRPPNRYQINPRIFNDSK
jgi:putative DNA primase/helicase